jgi:ectoine hydroxylase-related dioxygenase (phytanoyl-CoA dioxygenase family)
MTISDQFVEFHEALAARLATSRRSRAAAADVAGQPALALRLVGDGGPLAAYTYRAAGGAIRVEPGDAGAGVVAEVDEAAFDDLTSERATIFGLLFPGRINVARGRFDDVVAWEAALTSVWFDRPIYGDDLDALQGLDLGRTFELGDPDEEIAAFLHAAGFAVIRGVFGADEIAAFDAEERRLRRLATPDDKRSWWARNAAGDDVCCRLTYTSLRSSLFGELHEEPRLRRIAGLHGAPLRSAFDRLDGHSVVIKNAGVVSGLSDLPWHRDCGMGGHPVLCPSLQIGIQLDVASAANGQLVFLAGSHHHTNRIGSVAEHPEWPTIAVDARPGDVTVHYSHVLHAAPPPTASDAHRRTLYVSFNNPRVFDVVPPGQGYNDVVFSHGDGRVKAPAEIS